MDLVDNQSAYLSALATSWLHTGAASFSVWNSGERIACWPSDAPERSDLAVSLQVGAYELRVAGVCETAQERLVADARMLERVLALEADLEQMTDALIETQDQLLAFYELTEATRDQLSITEILHRLAYKAAHLLNAEGTVLLLDPMFMIHPKSFIDYDLLRPYFQQVYGSGQELVIDSDDPQLPEGLHNICILPIRVRNGVDAALGILNRDKGFLAPDIKLARAIAEQAGIQLEHALLYQETLYKARLQAELDIARKVQQQMLPQHRPAISSLEVYAASRSASEIGGDFFDFVTEPNRHPVFIIGDVAGKGISAALIVGMIHAITHSAARFMPAPRPASILFRTNEHLYDDLTTLEAIVTVFVAQYDATERMLHYSNAGHTPILYRPFGGPARLLEPEGLPVGVLLENFCENQTVDFGPGSLLVAATDGLNEAQDPTGTMFGYERLLRFIDEFADEPAQVIAEALFDVVRDFAAGAPQNDDQTLIVIKGVAP